MGCNNTKLKVNEVKTKGNQVGNGDVKCDDSPPEKKMRAMKGDLVQRKDARKDREKKLKEKRNKTIQKAMLMSDKIMDDRERLSLTSSRATSRAGTPAADRKSRSAVNPLIVNNGSVPPSEVDEDNYNNEVNNDKHNTAIVDGHEARKGSGYQNLTNGDVVKQSNHGGRTLHSDATTNSNNNNNDDHKITDHDEKGGDKEDDAQNLSGVQIETVDVHDT